MRSKNELLLALEKKAVDKSKEKLLSFISYLKKDYESNWHHKFVCEKIDSLVRGDISRLMLMMPPRHGKSEITSRNLPAFTFGLNPNEQIIACSYGSDLSSRMSRDVQRVMEADEYNVVFPDACLLYTSPSPRDRQKSRMPSSA